jgi:predicted phosphodiesterase
MTKLDQFRDPELSLWQSAVDETLVSRSQAAGKALCPRENPAHDLVQNALSEAKSFWDSLQKGLVHPKPDADAKGGQVGYCASLARNCALARARGDLAAAESYHAQLTQKEGDCDPHWAETATKYFEFLVSRQKPPYRVYTDINDFVIEGKLPDKARVAIVGDWGTGQPVAKVVLQQVARKKPDVVIHMGDIYYSATDFEVQNYFYKIWSETLDLSKVATYTLCGNHDMFGGGAPYYKLLDQLGQPASYFCLRNRNWQFLAMDTGLHDAKPLGNEPTYLENSEVAWLKHKIDTRGGRRTVLLSHHQLFAAYEDICGKAVNERLKAQLDPLLPNVDLWLWGHEHNLVLYEPYLGVLGRCIGHGAFPIGKNELPPDPKFPEVPVLPVRLSVTGDFYSHGYAIMDLAGDAAKISYYEDTNEEKPQYDELLGDYEQAVSTLN